MGSSTSIALVKAAQIPITILASLGYDTLFPEQPVMQNDTWFDYIVVGGGTAGCIVATRLAEDQENSVLLVEAGGNPPVTAFIPGLSYLLQDSYEDYNYSSTYDDVAASSQNGHTKFASGKMLGGSASFSYNIHTRGTRSNFDYWAEISGDDSWRYENVLKYFIKSESLHDDEILDVYPDYHGTEGPTGLTRELHPELNDYFVAFAEMGNPHVLDLNADISVGYTQPQYTIYKNVRQTPAITYFRDAKDYSNLHYCKETRVTKIIMNGTVAVGVKAVHAGETYIWKARKEIIISAGVYGTPQLLMLSGIGPKDHLKEMNIDVILDLPVGDNLIDHAAVQVTYKTKEYVIPLISPKILDVLNFNQVPFGIMLGSVALNKSQTTDPNYQAYCLLFPHDTPSLTWTCANPLGFRTDICDSLQQQVISRDALFCFLLNLQPKSRGTVRLKSTDPFDDPEIITGYYTEKKDLENMEKNLRDFIKVGKSRFFEEEGAKLVGLDIEKCKDMKHGSSDFWQCYILHRTISSFQTVGTCAMGTVVNGKLKMNDVENVRIVDASIMPVDPSGAPMAAVIMIAEKAADMIRNDNSELNSSSEKSLPFSDILLNITNTLTDVVKEVNPETGDAIKNATAELAPSSEDSIPILDISRNISNSITNITKKVIPETADPIEDDGSEPDSDGENSIPLSNIFSKIINGLNGYNPLNAIIRH